MQAVSDEQTRVHLPAAPGRRDEEVAEAVFVLSADARAAGAILPGAGVAWDSRERRDELARRLSSVMDPDVVHARVLADTHQDAPAAAPLVRPAGGRTGRSLRASAVAEPQLER